MSYLHSLLYTPDKLGHANSTTTQLVYSYLMWHAETETANVMDNILPDSLHEAETPINKKLMDTKSQKRPPDFSGGLEFTGAIGQSRTDAPLLRRSLLGHLSLVQRARNT